ncbi:hypothetical protein LEP1GSC171_1314 [Leptospira santarosai str. HAI1380]|uniref:LIC_13246 family protein n=1 Tax=Leptospira santarosai TaxID=28183 RepID=UPI0002BEF04B|nr:hypothetical protein [Leptospira santarosai]EMP03493.1 hypothetical protein LEP1GSC171_1314 [Leptospira santarosai str. HAI1380]
MEDDSWREMNEQGIKEFLIILKVLDAFYSANRKETSREELKFRSKLQTEKDIRIFLKALDKSGYYILAQLKENGKLQSKNWIHIDGIQEEKERFRELGDLTHPIFKVTCVTDIFNKHSIIANDFLLNPKL